jgi:pilus assembly protein Flp/PilA
MGNLSQSKLPEAEVLKTGFQTKEVGGGKIQALERRLCFFEQNTKHQQPNTKTEGEWKMKKLINFFKGEEGAAMVEYGLLVALIAVVCILAVTGVGTAVRDKFTDVSDALK